MSIFGKSKHEKELEELQGLVTLAISVRLENVLSARNGANVIKESGLEQKIHALIAMAYVLNKVDLSILVAPDDAYVEALLEVAPMLSETLMAIRAIPYVQPKTSEHEELPSIIRDGVVTHYINPRRSEEAELDELAEELIQERERERPPGEAGLIDRLLADREARNS